MIILLSLFLSFAHGKYSQLEPEKTYEPVAKTGRYKAELNCLKAMKGDDKIPYAGYSGTHEGKSGFYVLTNDNIHFYPVDKKTHAQCFMKATEPELYLTKQRVEEKEKRLDGKKSIGDVLDEADGKFNDPDPESMDQTLNFLKRISDNYQFKLQPAHGTAAYISYFTAKPEPDDEFHFLTSSVVVSEKPSKNKATCEIKEHEMVSDEAKADLEEEILEHISFVHDLFEAQIKRKMGDDYAKLLAEDSLERPTNNRGARTALKTSTKTYTLPNPQTYINRLNACKDVKSLAIIAALETELLKFQSEQLENNESPLTNDEVDKAPVELKNSKQRLSR